MIKTGDIVRVPFPLMEKANASKYRYGVVISGEKFHGILGSRRYIVAYITSSMPSHLIEGWEFLLKEGTEEFSNSGLLRSSLIKAHRLAMVQDELIEKVVGCVSIDLVKEIREKAIRQIFDL